MKYLFIVLSLFSLTACGKSHYVNCTDVFNAFEQGPRHKMDVGTTTQEQVVVLMGPPDRYTLSDYTVYELGAPRDSSNYCGVITFIYTAGGDGNPDHDLFYKAFESKVFDKQGH